MSENLFHDIVSELKENDLYSYYNDEELTISVIPVAIRCVTIGLIMHHNKSINYWPCIDGIMFTLREHPRKKDVYAFTMGKSRECVTSNKLISCIDEASKLLSDEMNKLSLSRTAIIVVVETIYEWMVANKIGIHFRGELDEFIYDDNKSVMTPYIHVLSDDMKLR